MVWLRLRSWYLMEIIPAIDLRNQQSVRLYQGDLIKPR